MTLLSLSLFAFSIVCRGLVVLERGVVLVGFGNPTRVEFNVATLDLISYLRGVNFIFLGFSLLVARGYARSTRLLCRRIER